MNKAEMIEDIELIIKANKDNDYISFYNLGEMIKEVIDNICGESTDKSLLKRLNKGEKKW